MTTSITFPPNLWQTWKVYHPSGRAGASKYFPHRLKKKKRETDQFVKLLSSLEFSLSPSKFLYSAYPTIVYCGQWLNLKQICHLKIKMLSPGDFKMLSKENRSKRALQLSDFFLIFFLFFFFCLFCPCKVKKLSHITLLLNTREHTGLCGICCNETNSLLASENRNRSWSSPRTLVSCGRNVEARMLVK